MGANDGDDHHGGGVIRAVLAVTGLDAAEQAELVLTVALFTQVCTFANPFALDSNDPRVLYRESERTTRGAT